MPESTRIDYHTSALARVFPVLAFVACVFCIVLAALPWWLTLLFVTALVVIGVDSLRRLRTPVREVVLQGDQWLLRMKGSQALQPALLCNAVWVSRWLLVVDLQPEGQGAAALRLYFAADNTGPDVFRRLSRHIHRQRYSSSPS